MLCCISKDYERKAKYIPNYFIETKQVGKNENNLKD